MNDFWVGFCAAIGFLGTWYFFYPTTFGPYKQGFKDGRKSTMQETNDQ